MIDNQPTSPGAHQPTPAVSIAEIPSSAPPATSLNSADPLLTPEQASAYFGGAPSAKTLEYYRAKGVGPDYIALARRIYYRRSALDAYLDKCVVEVSKRGSRRKKAA
jgi:hypothetical protein